MCELHKRYMRVCVTKNGLYQNRDKYTFKEHLIYCDVISIFLMRPKLKLWYNYESACADIHNISDI